MKICGGHYRGRTLSTPSGYHIRPTSDKVRQAVFNMLESREFVQGAHVIDAFCGTGALGLEALSRGAEFCVFIDNDQCSIKTCTSNVNMIGVQKDCTILYQDSVQLTKKLHTVPQASLVFLDPPYHQDLVLKTISCLEEGEWTQEGVIYVIESEKDFEFSLSGFGTVQEKIYKDTKIIIVQKQKDET